MNKTKKNTYRAAIFIFCLLQLSSLIAAENVLMRATAMKSLAEWKKTLKQQDVQKLGFENLEDFRTAVLGKPIKQYTVTPANIMEYEREMRFEEFLTDTGYYIYPIKSHGKTKALMWIYKKENTWKTARIGSAGMAKYLMDANSILEHEITARDLNLSLPHKLVRVYQLYLDFYYIGDEQQEFIIPFQNIPLLEIESNKFYTPDQLVPRWKEEMKNIKTDKALRKYTIDKALRKPINEEKTYIFLKEEAERGAKPIIQIGPSILDEETLEGSISIRFDLPGIWSSKKHINEREFTLFEIPDGGFLHDVGSPSIPSISIEVEIPSSASFKEIQVESNLIKEFENINLFPVQEPRPIKESFLINRTLYEQTEPYPGEFYEIITDGFLGDKHIIVLRLFPIQFTPSAHLVKAYNLELKLTYRKNNKLGLFLGHRESMYPWAP